jgi:uncharacterized radical SAM protein YgiQ
MFIPTTINEYKKLNWKSLDVILVTGDCYIDSPYVGIAVIGKYLIQHGYKIGIISQPSLNIDTDILRLGLPNLFWGVTAGAMDSMVSNYTALKKKRKYDVLTVNRINNKRPDRATIRYVNLIKQCSKNILNTKKPPIIIGGIEASLRRLAHYDYWDNSVRRSILLDSKADVLVYGEGEKTILEIANAYKNHQDIKHIRGICYVSNSVENLDYIELPSYQEVVYDKIKFKEMFNTFYQNTDPINANGLIQKFENKYVIQNPPNYYLEGKELDLVYELDYENDTHPIHKSEGKVIGLETTKNSIITHRGCFGECNFCAIAIHQGRKIRSRSKESIIREATKLTSHKYFKGNINDLGGASSNMYMMECRKQNQFGSCKNKRCLSPIPCKSMNICHSKHLLLIKEIKKINKINNVFVNSGLRYDLIQYDKKSGKDFFEYIVLHCTSGQMKIAPEHTENSVLQAMAKPSANLLKFINDFYSIAKKLKKKQFLTYYLIAGHPICSEKEMQKMKTFFSKELKVIPEQIQIFTPTPSTYSTMMYYCELDYKTNNKIFVEKSLQKLRKQKEIFRK